MNPDPHTGLPSCACFSKAANHPVRKRPRGRFSKVVSEYNRYIRDWLVKQVEDIESDLNKLEEEIGIEENPTRKKSSWKLRSPKPSSLPACVHALKSGTTFSSRKRPSYSRSRMENGSSNRRSVIRNLKRACIPLFISSFLLRSVRSVRIPTIRSGENCMTMLRSLWSSFTPRLEKLCRGGQRMGLEFRSKNGFFRLDPDAKYNDGVPVKAEDFMWWVYLRASDNVVTPWFKQYIREQWSQFTLYGDDLIAISFPSPSPSLHTSPACLLRLPHFTNSTDLITRSAISGEFRPTATYTVNPDDLVKGVSITPAGWTTGGPPTRNSTVTVSTPTESAILW